MYRWRYVRQADEDTLSGISCARACMVDIHVQVEICMADGDTCSGIGYARACMVDIHVQVEICMSDGETHSLG